MRWPCVCGVKGLFFEGEWGIEEGVVFSIVDKRGMNDHHEWVCFFQYAS